MRPKTPYKNRIAPALHRTYRTVMFEEAHNHTVYRNLPAMNDQPSPARKQPKRGVSPSVSEPQSSRSGGISSQETPTPERFKQGRRTEDLLEREKELKNAKKRAQMGKTRDDLTEEERMNERRAANRLSAFQSRQRRKTIIEDLQVRSVCNHFHKTVNTTPLLSSLT